MLGDELGGAGGEMGPHGHGHPHPTQGWTSFSQAAVAEGKDTDLVMQGPMSVKEEDAVKLFVGQIPKDMDEDALRPFFERYGSIFEITVIRDKSTKAHRGCAFLTFCQRQSAFDAIDALHDKMRLGSAVNCLQVRPAESQSERENKLFIGMLPKTMAEAHLQEMFGRFGEIREIHIIRSTEGLSKGCAFVKFMERDAALQAIQSLHDTVPEGSTRPLVVKFADNKKQTRKPMMQSSPTSASALPGGSSVRGRGPQSADFWVSQSAYPYPMQTAPPIPHQVIPAYVQYGATPQLGPTYPLYYTQNHFFPPYAQPTGFGPVASSPLSQQSAPPQTMSLPPSQPQTPSAPVDSPSRPAPNTRPAEGPVGANLFIYHLPQGLTDADLATLFSNFGNVISAKVFVDKQTSESKGFGFVSYDSVASAETAIQVMNGFQIGNKRLKVQHKKERAGAPDHMTFMQDPISMQAAGYFEGAPDSPNGIMGVDGHGHGHPHSLVHGHVHAHMASGSADSELAQQLGTLRLDGI